MERIARVVLGYALWLTSAALLLWAGLWLRIVLVVDVPIRFLYVSDLREQGMVLPPWLVPEETAGSQ
jgi:hypothetical protein